MKENRVMDWRREQAIKLRNEEGLTYREIAEQMGVTKSYVGLLLASNVKNKNFHALEQGSLPYPALVEWMNENQVGKAELAQAVGYSPSSNSKYNLYRKLKDGTLTMRDINRMLDFTGLTYEKLFEKGG